ncbi:MAG: hypothetical protein IKO27_04090 [Ruminococcus sp.]|nr:hypothetical protein [Ruminococcus sp.]
MTELIKEYERQIEAVRRRSAELKRRMLLTTDIDEINSLRSRTELLEEEMYELMYSAALMRRNVAPKPITPSFAARMAGDAAC